MLNQEEVLLFSFLRFFSWYFVPSYFNCYCALLTKIAFVSVFILTIFTKDYIILPYVLFNNKNKIYKDNPRKENNMKKQTKLFAILLTLALVFGTVVVTAIATSSFGHDYAQDEQNTVDGEVIRTHINFDSLETVNYGAATEITADPTFKSDNNKTAALYYKGRNGNCSIVEATQGAANKYLHVDLDMAYHTTFPGYLSLSLGNGVSKPEHLEGRTLDDIKYHVVDFDFYAPNGYASEKGYFGALLQLRVLNQNGEIKDITTAGYRQSTAGYQYQIRRCLQQLPSRLDHPHSHKQHRMDSYYLYP